MCAFQKVRVIAFEERKLNQFALAETELALFEMRSRRLPKAEKGFDRLIALQAELVGTERDDLVGHALTRKSILLMTKGEIGPACVALCSAQAYWLSESDTRLLKEIAEQAPCRPRSP